MNNLAKGFLIDSFVWRKTLGDRGGVPRGTWGGGRRERRGEAEKLGEKEEEKLTEQGISDCSIRSLEALKHLI